MECSQPHDRHRPDVMGYACSAQPDLAISLKGGNRGSSGDRVVHQKSLGFVGPQLDFPGGLAAAQGP